MRPYLGDEAFDAEVKARSEKLKASTQEFLRLHKAAILRTGLNLYRGYSANSVEMKIGDGGV